MTDILMPRLSDSMESGVLVQWLIQDGGEVHAGDELVEIETDKATMTYEAQASGTLEIFAPAGSTVAVGEVIARLRTTRQQAEPRRSSPTPDGQQQVAAGRPADNNPAGVAVAGAPMAVAATPLARRLAQIHGVMLEGITGSGPRGRVTKADVLRAAGLEVVAGEVAGTAAAGAALGLAGEAATQREDGVTATGRARATEGRHAHRQQLTRTQQLIAQRMAQAKATIPHFQVQTEVEMDEALALRAQLRECAERAGDERLAPSINDLIVRASAIALSRHPLVNGSYRDGELVVHENVNIGIAVAAEGMLVVPTIFDADLKSLGQIALESRRLAERVRNSQITPPELSGATFTISNLGMYGMTAITPVINPPQAAILGVGATRPVLTRDTGGEILQRTLLTLTLSCDHRILYGADAARFLAEIRDLLHQPLRILL